MESPPTESSSPELQPWLPVHIDIAPVSVVDGIWQDEPDHLAAFDEARLGAGAQGRGNLYLLLDVSGEIEGRAEVERELIETIRREYATRRGSITFGLSEALRAANANLFELNVAAERAARRMAGISAVVLRGQDMYIAQAGPTVVYVEANGELRRYPNESDWFAEDQPLISPQGNASPPLGVRREFTCDLFHVSVRAGDVFVLATRALTQLVGTEELAGAFADRSAEDIASFLEEIASGGDLTALVAELVDPADVGKTPAVVEAEFPAPEEMEEGETEPEVKPVAARYAAQVNAPFVADTEEAPEEKLARRREERRQRREAQWGNFLRVMRRVGASVGALVAVLANIFSRAWNRVDWARLGAAINRALNLFFLALWNLLALLVRLILPGAPGRQTALIPRRAPKEAIWLKATAVMLPVLFALTAFAARYEQDVIRASQANDLVQRATVLEQSAASNADTNAARQQLNDAFALINNARQIHDSKPATDELHKIQDQLNQLDGIAILREWHLLVAFSNTAAHLTRVVVADTDLYVLDHGAQQIYHYALNDTVGSAAGESVILKVGAKIGEATVDQIRDIVWVDAGGAAAKPALVAITNNALLQYNPVEANWRASVASDAAQWGDVRAADGFFGNVYLLDAAKQQLWKYIPTANGYASQAAPYLPANAGVSFSNAVDVAIDGDVWVLNREGTVLRLRGGQRIPFDLSGFTLPLKNPVAIFTRPEVDTLYIADAGNQRIVELDKNGKFVREFKPPAQDSATFNALQALFADETRRKFIFINGNAVYLANVPK